MTMSHIAGRQNGLVQDGFDSWKLIAHVTLHTFKIMRKADNNPRSRFATQTSNRTVETTVPE